MRPLLLSRDQGFEMDGVLLRPDLEIMLIDKLFTTLLCNWFPGDVEVTGPLHMIE